MAVLSDLLTIAGHKEPLHLKRFDEKRIVCHFQGFRGFGPLAHFSIVVENAGKNKSRIRAKTRQKVGKLSGRSSGRADRMAVIWRSFSMERGTKLSPFFEENFHASFQDEPMNPGVFLKAGWENG